MIVAYNDNDVDSFLSSDVFLSRDHPVVISKFIQEAKVGTVLWFCVILFQFCMFKLITFSEPRKMFQGNGMNIILFVWEWILIVSLQLSRQCHASRFLYKRIAWHRSDRCKETRIQNAANSKWLYIADVLSTRKFTIVITIYNCLSTAYNNYIFCLVGDWCWCCCLRW